MFKGFEVGAHCMRPSFAWLITTEKGEKEAERILQNRPKNDD